MKISTVLICSVLISLSSQLMGMDPPQKAVDKMSLNYALRNGSSVFQLYKERLEIRDKGSAHPQYALKRKRAEKLAEIFSAEPETCQSVISIYRYFDFDGLLLPDSPVKDVLNKRIKRIAEADGCEEEYEKIQSDYSTKIFNELLEQKVSKEDVYAIKVVNRFLARYRKFVDDKELVLKVLTLKKQGNVTK